MWLFLKEWAKKNTLLAIIIVGALIVVFSGAVDGISARRAATRYFDLAKGWAAAYSRDIAASKKQHEAEMRVLTADRDAYRKKYEAAKGKMGTPWTPPKGAQALQERFNQMGYRGRVK